MRLRGIECVVICNNVGVQWGLKVHEYCEFYYVRPVMLVFSLSSDSMHSAMASL